MGSWQTAPFSGRLLDEDEFADIGTIPGQVDGASAFATNVDYRAAARRAFVHEDTSKRVQRAMLRNAAPLPGNYSIGDLVSYRREARTGETGTQWSVASRIIGFEDSKAVWITCEGVPVLVALDRLRPCTAAEALAYQYLSKDRVEEAGVEPLRAGGQQGFVDARGSLDPHPQVDDAVPGSEQLHPVQGEHGDEDEPVIPPAEPGDEQVDSEGPPGLVDDFDDEVEMQDEREEEPLPEPPLADRQSRRAQALDDFPREAFLRRRVAQGPTPEESRAVPAVIGNASNASLLDNFRRSGTEGPGVDLLESRANYVSFIGTCTG